MFLVGFRGNLVLYFRLHNMVDRQVHGNSGKRSRPAGVAVSHRLGVEFSAVGIGSTQNDYQVVLAVLVNDLLNILLTLRVKCTGGGSDKALCLHQQWFCPGTLHALGNSRALHSIAFANNNDPLPFQFHLYLLI